MGSSYGADGRFVVTDDAAICEGCGELSRLSRDGPDRLWLCPACRASWPAFPVPEEENER